MNIKKNFWVLVGIGVSIVVLLIILSSVLSVGERLRTVNPYVEIGFYVLSFILVYVLIINPVRIILFAPTFSVATVLDPVQQKKRNRKTYRRVTRNIIRTKNISDEDKEQLMMGLKDPEIVREKLNTYFNTTLKSEINRIIISNAKTVMISTAISQNGRLDMFAVITVNLKMIKEIVMTCGFRPSYTKLGKLSANVFATSLIAEGLEGINISDLFPTQTANFLSEIPLIKPITSSIIQGISNALLTIRIGIVTRRYLFTEYKEISRSEIRRYSFKESIKLLPIVIRDVLAYFPSKIGKLFFKRKLTPEEEEILETMRADSESET